MPLFEDILKDTISLEEITRREKREVESLNASIKTGSGIKPNKLKIFNKQRKQQGLEPLTLREYLKEKEILDYDIDSLQYEIYCTQEYLSDTFGVEIDSSLAVNISSIVFRSYYEEGNDQLEHVRAVYPKIVSAVKHAHETSLTKLHHAKQALMSLDIDENAIPLELKAAIYIREKYAKNKKKQALKDILVELLPQINNEIILEEIVINALQ